MRPLIDCGDSAAAEQGALGLSYSQQLGWGLRLIFLFVFTHRSTPFTSFVPADTAPPAMRAPPFLLLLLVVATAVCAFLPPVPTSPRTPIPSIGTWRSSWLAGWPAGRPDSRARACVVTLFALPSFPCTDIARRAAAPSPTPLAAAGAERAMADLPPSSALSDAADGGRRRVRARPSPSEYVLACLPACLPCLSICLSVCLPACLLACLYVCLSVNLA